MRNFFKTQKILISFHFRRLRKYCCITRRSRKTRKFLKVSFSQQTRKIILRNIYLIDFNDIYFSNPHLLLENLYICLESKLIDLQKLPRSFAVQKELEKISKEMKWLEKKEGVDLP